MCFRRKAILMIHGFVGGNYDYGNLNNELELYRNFDVYTYTLPGHEKVIVNDVKYTEWIKESERQIEFLISNGYKKIYIIGHSMGGVIATHLASKYPQVKKLVLAAPAFAYFYFKDGKVDIKDLTQTIKNIPGIFKGYNTDTILSRIIKTPLSTMLEFTKLVEKYKSDALNITCPTLIIHGMDDAIVPIEGTNYAHDSIKSNTNILVNIKHVNHDCFTQKRQDEVKALIKKFLQKKPSNKIEVKNI